MKSIVLDIYVLDFCHDNKMNKTQTTIHMIHICVDKQREQFSYAYFFEIQIVTNKKENLFFFKWKIKQNQYIKMHLFDEHNIINYYLN